MIQTWYGWEHSAILLLKPDLTDFGEWLIICLREKTNLNVSAGLGAYPSYFTTVLPWSLTFAQFHGISWGQGWDSWCSDPCSRPNQTNMSLTLRVNQQAEDSQACRREAILTMLKAARGGHNSSSCFHFNCFQGYPLRVSLPAFRLQTSRG